MPTDGPYAAPELETPFAEWEGEDEGAWEGEAEDEGAPIAVRTAGAAGRPALQAVSFYARVTGRMHGVFAGDSQARGRAGWLTGRAFAQQVTAPRDVATGMASGRRVHHPLVLSFGWGTASPQFLSALAANEVLQVELEFLDTDRTGAQVLAQRVRLTDATIAGVRRTAAPGGPPVDEVTLVVGAVEVIDVRSGTSFSDHPAAEAEAEAEAEAAPPWATSNGELPAADAEFAGEAPPADGWTTESYEPAGSGVRPCDDQRRLA